MAGFRSFVSRVIARIDERVDRDPDPDALTGRSGSRRHGQPLVPPVPEADRAATDRTSNADTEQDAQDALERIRTDQARRMRRGTFGRRPGGA